MHSNKTRLRATKANKIAIIGCGGAGKSTLSIALGELLSIPVYHLDQLFWKPGWSSIDRDEFISRQNSIFTNKQWIIDGNYGGTMKLRFDEAETIIFLDLPTLVCIYGVLSRFIKYRKVSRPDMTEGNAERITLEFLKYVWTYRKVRRPSIMEKLKDQAKTKKVIVLKTRQEIAQFLANTTNNKSASDASKVAPLTKAQCRKVIYGNRINR